MTQHELADLIERGFHRSEVIETMIAFLFKRREPEGEPTYQCCMLGAGLAKLHGLEAAWKMWLHSQPTDFITLSAEQFGIPRKLARDIAYDHQALCNARQAILAKLRANQYTE